MTRPDTKRTIATDARSARHDDGPLGQGFSLGSWGGVPIRAHWTALFTLTLFAEVLASTVLPAARPGLGTAVYWAVGLLTAVAFLATLLLHELAHATTARHYGVEVRGVTLWMLGGVTELGDTASTPRADALIAAAGPAASLGMGGLGALFAWAVGPSTLFGSALAWLAVVNVVLALFNLLPGSPLDGGRIVRAAVWARSGDQARAVEIAGRTGRVLGFLLLGLGIAEFAAGSSGGLWLALIGWFVMSSANAERRQGASAGLAGLRAEDAMTPVASPVAEWWTVEQFYAAHGSPVAAAEVLPLADFGGEATGALTGRDLERVALERRDEVRLRDILRARRIPPLVLGRDATLTGVASVLRLHGGVAVIVDEALRPIGTITEADLGRAVAYGVRGRVIDVDAASGSHA